MVVVMTGSPQASAYPGPSAEVWAKRAAKEAEGSKLRTNAFEELRQQVLTKKQREDKEKKAKKAEAERKFREEQAARAAKAEAERAQRNKVRGQSLAQIESEKAKTAREERIREANRVAMAKMRIKDQADGVMAEDELEMVIDAGDVKFSTEIAKEALRQRRIQEEEAERHEIEAKLAREKKAMEKEAADKARRDEMTRAQREENYRIKKEMAAQTKREQEKAAAAEEHQKKLRAAYRKKNDEYDAWLGKGDILRDEMELMNERREGSAMHKGGRFSGVPDTKVDGKGNQ